MLPQVLDRLNNKLFIPGGAYFHVILKYQDLTEALIYIIVIINIQTWKT